MSAITEPGVGDASAPAAPVGEAAVSSVRRRHRKSGRRPRDLTPEEDNRRRQWRAILVILPSILTVIGGGVWIAGAWGPDQYLRHVPMIRTGVWLTGLGGAALLFVLLRQWRRKIEEAIREWLNPPMDTSRHRRRHRRDAPSRRRRSSRPSAFRAK